MPDLEKYLDYDESGEEYPGEKINPPCRNCKFFRVSWDIIYDVPEVECTSPEMKHYFSCFQKK